MLSKRYQWKAFELFIKNQLQGNRIKFQWLHNYFLAEFLIGKNATASPSLKRLYGTAWWGYRNLSRFAECIKVKSTEHTINIIRLANIESYTKKYHTHYFANDIKPTASNKTYDRTLDVISTNCILNRKTFIEISMKKRIPYTNYVLVSTEKFREHRTL